MALHIGLPRTSLSRLRAISDSNTPDIAGSTNGSFPAQLHTVGMANIEAHPRPDGMAAHRRGGWTAGVQISVLSASNSASSMSTPRYLTVFSILVWPSRIWMALMLPVAR